MHRSQNQQAYRGRFGNGRTAAGVGGSEVLLPQSGVGLDDGHRTGTVAVQDRRVSTQVVPKDGVVGRIDGAVAAIVAS